MSSNDGLSQDLGTDSSDLSELALRLQSPDDPAASNMPRAISQEYEYEIMTLRDKRYLCQIPQIDESSAQDTNETLSREDEERELARANERGWSLLSEMQGHCIYFWSGWWSYRYCYGQGVKQFHQLAPQAGQPPYPPVEDPSVAGFMLGRVEETVKQKTDAGVQNEIEQSSGKKRELAATKALGRLEVRGDNRYLVQKLVGGDACDLTGQNRRVEVQVSQPRQSYWR